MSKILQNIQRIEKKFELVCLEIFPSKNHKFITFSKKKCGFWLILQSFPNFPNFSTWATTLLKLILFWNSLIIKFKLVICINQEKGLYLKKNKQGENFVILQRRIVPKISIIQIKISLLAFQIKNSFFSKCRFWLEYVNVGAMHPFKCNYTQIIFSFMSYFLQSDEIIIVLTKTKFHNILIIILLKFKICFNLDLKSTFLKIPQFPFHSNKCHGWWQSRAEMAKGENRKGKLNSVRRMEWLLASVLYLLLLNTPYVATLCHL